MNESPQWVEAADNPFGVRMLDVRAFTRTVTSTTSDPAVAQRFLQLRAFDGGGLRGAMPEGAIAERSGMRYETEIRLVDGPLFRAKEMEDKWDIDRVADRLYFRRSWTGQLALVAGVLAIKGGFGIPAVLVSPGRGATTAVADVDFLVKTYLLGRELPHMLPADFPDDPQQIMTYSFSAFGRAAAFATYADTIGKWAR